MLAEGHERSHARSSIHAILVEALRKGTMVEFSESRSRAWPALKSPTGKSHHKAARVLLLGRLVEHLALRAQVGALCYEVVQFLAALKNL